MLQQPFSTSVFFYALFTKAITGVGGRVAGGQSIIRFCQFFQGRGREVSLFLQSFIACNREYCADYG